MAEGLKSVDGAWQKQMVVKVYEAIIRSDMTLKQTISVCVSVFVVYVCVCVCTRPSCAETGL